MSAQTEHNVTHHHSAAQMFMTHVPVLLKTHPLSPGGMEVDCQPEESIISSFDEDCVVLGDVKDMRLEAEAVVNDVLFAVSEMHVSQSLNSASDVAYINVETREGNRFCLELTEAGLRVRCTKEGHSGFLCCSFLFSMFTTPVHSDFDNK